MIELYRSHFGLLDENERGTWYDQDGRIVWTYSKGIAALGWRDARGRKPTEADWTATYAKMSQGETLEHDLTIDFLPGEAKAARRVYRAPFTICDRETDYRRAWAFFESNLEKKAA
jgi:ribosomal protein L24E